MSTSRKSIAFVLVLFVAFAGCRSVDNKSDTGKPGTQQVQATPGDQAKAQLLKELDRKFEDPQSHVELARLYQRDGLWAKAHWHYNVAIGFEPANRDAQAGLVKVLAAMGDDIKSRFSAELYTSQVASSAAESLKLALAFQNQQLDDDAVICYQQALRLAPNSAKVNRQVGYYHLSKGDKGRAMDYLSRSFQLDPTQAEVAGELGRLGVSVQVPRGRTGNSRKLDQIVDEADNSRRQAQ